MNCSGLKTTTGIIHAVHVPMVAISYGCTVTDLKVASLPSVTSNDLENGQGINMAMRYDRKVSERKANQTAGHCANSMGVRGHSAGEIFPAVIMIKGCFATGFKYHVLNHPMVDERTGWKAYGSAHKIASMRARF